MLSLKVFPVSCEQNRRVSKLDDILSEAETAVDDAEMLAASKDSVQTRSFLDVAFVRVWTEHSTIFGD